MMSALIITLRETLEAALIVGIILTYLNKTLNFRHKKIVWYAVASGIVLSIISAFIFENYFGGFEGRIEELYEGITMFVAAMLITWMILWMLRQRKKLRKNIENKLAAHIEKDHPVGIFLLTFVGVAREGIETVIFLQAVAISNDGKSIFMAAVSGISLAIIFSYLLFKGIYKISLSKFFTITSVLLILFAAGLLAHGVHEFQEFGILPIYIEHLWDINSVLSEEGLIGSFLKALFGYNGNPSLLEVMVYFVYLIIIAALWWKIEKWQKFTPSQTKVL